MPDKNIIQKQSLYFQYNGNTDVFALQKEVSDWCKYILVPEIEEHLEPFALANDYLKIDRLTIDAKIDRKDWQQQIRNELISALSLKLKDYKPAQHKKPDELKNENRLHKLDELILFYFEKGYLPWWSKALVENDFDAVLIDWIKEEKSQARADEILLKLQQINAAPVIQRIVNQVPARLFFKLLQRIFKSETETISEAESFFNEMLRAVETKPKQKIISIAFYGAMLAMFIKNKGKADVGSSLQVLGAIIKKETGVADTGLKTLPGKPTLSDNRFAKAWQSILAEEMKDSSGKHSREIKKEGKHTYHRAIEQLTNKTFTKNSEEEVAADLREGIYIENAGAVIIAAFLPRLFERLGIYVNAQVVKPDLAALMIQYLVTGKTKAKEYELLLPKILCGINPALPLKTKRITRAQQSEAVAMLGAVIEHWTAIKNTSVAGLRESFLQRKGKLIQIDHEWLLQVEQKAYDMLLQQLPWNISMIKLPWMKNLIKTEWI